jgi:hypothetical protein
MYYTIEYVKRQVKNVYLYNHGYPLSLARISPHKKNRRHVSNGVNRLRGEHGESERIENLEWEMGRVEEKRWKRVVPRLGSRGGASLTLHLHQVV